MTREVRNSHSPILQGAPSRNGLTRRTSDHFAPLAAPAGIRVQRFRLHRASARGRRVALCAERVPPRARSAFVHRPPRFRRARFRFHPGGGCPRRPIWQPVSGGEVLRVFAQYFSGGDLYTLAFRFRLPNPGVCRRSMYQDRPTLRATLHARPGQDTTRLWSSATPGPGRGVPQPKAGSGNRLSGEERRAPGDHHLGCRDGSSPISISRGASARASIPDRKLAERHSGRWRPKPRWPRSLVLPAGLASVPCCFGWAVDASSASP